MALPLLPGDAEVFELRAVACLCGAETLMTGYYVSVGYQGVASQSQGVDVVAGRRVHHGTPGLNRQEVQVVGDGLQAVRNRVMESLVRRFGKHAVILRKASDERRPRMQEKGKHLF